MKHFSKIATALFCVTVLLMQSCKKETDGPFRLSATIEKYNQANKVHIENDGEGSFTCWDVGDQVTVNGILSTVCQDDDGYYIEAQSGRLFSDDGGHQAFAALYPTSLFMAGGESSVYHGTTPVYLPQTQDYIVANGNQKINAPMIAYMEAGSVPPDNQHTMLFQNVCALIKINITNSTESSVGIKRIEIVNSIEHPFWGDFSGIVSVSDQSMVEPEDYADIASKIIPRKATLNVNGQTIDNGATKSFYIYVPAVAYSNLVMTIFTTNNTYRTYTGTVTSTFEANTIYSKLITYDGGNDWKTISTPTGDIGVFTVSATTNQETNITTYKKVTFAHGNLLSDGSISTNQYDYKGYYGNQGSVKDMFSSSDVPTLPSGYSLLTSDEWSYLLTNQNRGSIRWVPAMVNYNPGIILFPDNFTTPNGVTISGENILYTSTTSNSFDLEKWSLLEAEGCVFLPRINWIYAGLWSLNIVSYYWNKEENNTRNAMNFGNVLVPNASPTKAYIRLVKEIQQ